MGDCVCFNARSAARAITYLYDETLAPSGLRINQFATLAAIHQRHGGSMQTIAADLGLDPSTMTRVLRPLVEDGLVSAEPGENRRAKQLALTDLGQEKLRSTHALWQQAQDDLREKLDPGVFERLVGDLAKLHEALRP
ncbi:MAG: MarR family winged helix-turn-helix transcriptional regulator [Candidatus Binatia bacterium]|nr:MarR family winged helix-turn-helix transcriptional regulator [Candidatus Binatia bacterium]